jgi:hypothetical protein
MMHRLFYIALGGVTAIVAKELMSGGSKPAVKTVYKGIARVNRGLQRMAAEVREDLEDARKEVEREEAAQQPV